MGPCSSTGSDWPPAPLGTSTASSAAIHDVFAARAADAEAPGCHPRTWPVTITAYPHWRNDFAVAAAVTGANITLDDAVAQANAWLEAIEGSTS